MTRLRHLLCGLLTLGCVAVFAQDDAPKTAAKKPVELSTAAERASYGIGRFFGNQLKSDGLDVDLALLTRGIADAMEGVEDAQSQEDFQAAIEELQKAVQKKIAKKNEEFLKTVDKEKGVKSTESGLRYQVIKEGKGASPTAKDSVEAHYKGTLVDGKVFDSSYDRGEPATFPLSGVIKGWTEGVPLMKVGAKYKFWIPSELAYGARGRPGIPPNAILIFEIELLKVIPADGGDEPELKIKKKIEK